MIFKCLLILTVIEAKLSMTLLVSVNINYGKDNRFLYTVIHKRSYILIANVSSSRKTLLLQSEYVFYLIYSEVYQ